MLFLVLFCVLCSSVTLCPLGPPFFPFFLAALWRRRCSNEASVVSPPHTHTRWDCLSRRNGRSSTSSSPFPFSIRLFRRYCNLSHLHILAFAFCLSVFLPPQLLLLVIGIISIIIIIIIVVVVVVVVAVSELQVALSTSSSFLMFTRVCVCVCARVVYYSK